MELVAAEPLVASPVATAFDERGRLFVAEDRGYPTGPGEGKPPAGQIALLTDDDHDGRMDRRVELAEGLTFPNGVLPWDGGLIVTCAPEILFLRDGDGDGKADERRVLFTGFSTSGSTQLRVSHPNSFRRQLGPRHQRPDGREGGLAIGPRPASHRAETHRFPVPARRPRLGGGRRRGSVRAEDALQLAESRLARDPTWLGPAKKLDDDPDARVRAAIALGVYRPSTPMA